MFRLGARKLLGTLSPYGLFKCPRGRSRIAALGKKLLDERAPVSQAFPVALDVSRGIVGNAEVRQEEPRGTPFGDGIERDIPECEIATRRRRCGTKIRISFDAHACRVAHVRRAFRGIE